MEQAVSGHPLADLYAAQPPASRALGGGYRPLRALSRWAIRALVVAGLVDVVAFAVELNDRRILSSGLPGLTQLELYEGTRDAVALAQLAALAVTAIVFFVWLHRAHRNLLELGADSVRCSSRMAIGVWFIPMLNLIRPKHVLDDVWRGSNPEEARGSNVVGLWWTAFLLSWIVGNMSGATSTETLDALGRQNTFELASSGLSVVAAVVAVAMVRGISERQERRAAALDE
jgi:hypothetical protein